MNKDVVNSPLPFSFLWKLNMNNKFQLACTSFLCSLKRKSNLRCAMPVSGNKYFTPKSKVQKYAMPCYIYHLLSPDIKYVRLRHKIMSWNLTVANFRHCKMYVKLLAHLRHLTRQAEPYAPPSPATEQYLNKNWTFVREKIQNIYQINNRVCITFHCVCGSLIWGLGDTKIQLEYNTNWQREIIVHLCPW